VCRGACDHLLRVCCKYGKWTSDLSALGYGTRTVRFRPRRVADASARPSASQSHRPTGKGTLEAAKLVNPDPPATKHLAAINAARCFVESRGDRTPIELFRAGIRAFRSELRGHDRPSKSGVTLPLAAP